MKYLTVLLSLFLCQLIPAQNGYHIIEGNPIWISENYQSAEMQPWGSITNEGEVFEANSNFAKNPANNTSDFRFDYQITSHITVPGFEGDITYLVNSADNSIAIPFDGNYNATLRELLIAKHPDYSHLHFLIRKANRNLLACGLYKNPQTGALEKRGIDLGKDLPMNDVLGEDIWSQMYWFNRAEKLTAEDIGENGATPGMLEIVENIPIEGLRGETPEGTIVDMYFIKFPVMEKISVPFMGFGNGIIKNLKNRTNQLVVWLAARNIPWKGDTADLFFYLQKMYKVSAVFHPGDYAVTTLFNKGGMEDVKNFQQYAMQKAQQIRQLQIQARNCPEGDVGNVCRNQYEQQIKAIEKELRQKTKQLAERHKVPMN